MSERETPSFYTESCDCPDCTAWRATVAKPPENDPWKNRSQGMRCSTCMWFVAKASASGIPKIGRCRRHAPTMSGYPAVFPSDWCGDHKLDENKVAE